MISWWSKRRKFVSLILMKEEMRREFTCKRAIKSVLLRKTINCLGCKKAHAVHFSLFRTTLIKAWSVDSPPFELFALPYLSSLLILCPSPIPSPLLSQPPFYFLKSSSFTRFSFNCLLTTASSLDFKPFKIFAYSLSHFSWFHFFIFFFVINHNKNNNYRQCRRKCKCSSSRFKHYRIGCINLSSRLSSTRIFDNSS